MHHKDGILKTATLLALLITVAAAFTAGAENSHEDYESQKGNQKIQLAEIQSEPGVSDQGNVTDGLVEKIKSFEDNVTTSNTTLGNRNATGDAGHRPFKSSNSTAALFRNIYNSTAEKRRRLNHSTTTAHLETLTSSTAEPILQGINTSPASRRTHKFGELDPNQDYFSVETDSQESTTTAEPSSCSRAQDQLLDAKNEEFCETTSQLIRELRNTDEFRPFEETSFLVQKVDGKWQLSDFTVQMLKARDFVSAMMQSGLIPFNADDAGRFGRYRTGRHVHG